MTKRREFIKKSMMGTAGIVVGGMGFTSKSYAQIKRANNRINVAIIGLGGQGGGVHTRSYSSLKDSHNVYVTSLCDADEARLAENVKKIKDATGVTPATTWDMRKIFADPNIHAVSIATANYWHALATIWACQAGKHVYVEKPACYNIFEGRKMVEAARKYNVRVKVGLQNRSNDNVREAIKFLHDGGIGEVFLARGLCYKPRNSFGIAKDSTPPDSLHYDMWLGPVTWRPYNEKKGHYNWHWFWDTGNGDTGNQGPHQWDIARWGINKNEHPVSAYSTGGVYGIDPDECAQETPNTHSCVLKYKDGKMIEFETRGRYTNREGGLNVGVGNLFYGTEGYMEISGSTWKAYRQRETTPFAGSPDQPPRERPAAGAPGAAVQRQAEDFMMAPGGATSYANFIDAIRSGKDETLHCDVLEGHYSAALTHLSNISYRVGRELKFMGEYEKFANDPEADKLLTRNYRRPYVVPDEV